MIFPDTNAIVGIDNTDLIDQVVMKHVMDRQMKVRLGANWQVRIESLEEYFKFAWLAIYDHSQHGIVDTDDKQVIASVQLNTRSRQINMNVFCKESAAGQAFIKDARARIAEFKEQHDSHIVPISFWSMTAARGPRSIERDIVVPFWEDIGENYEHKTRERLDRLFNGFTPSKGGQLVLWHGLPGTGKTFALRSLVHSWIKWCSFEYIVDPERFFGDAEYMMHVLLEEARLPNLPEIYGGDNLLDESAEEEDEQISKRWRLLICEDTGELLMETAKDITGQGLSRLLNVVDGLIGQGLRVLILITTNEKLEKMHPAVTRPGRAAYNIEFNALTRAEAASWAAAHGIAAPGSSTTVASLYGALEGFEKGPSNGKSIGFAPPEASPQTHHPWSDIKRS
jgi:hypothetical protein